MRLGFVSGLFGLVLLFACTSVSPSVAKHYCLGAAQDGFADYLVEHGNEVARGVIHNEVIIVRDYSNQRYQLARRTADACSASEVAKSTAEIQSLVNANVHAAAGTYPALDSEEWCIVEIGRIDERERSTLFQYLARGGLKGISMESIDYLATVRIDDRCAAVHKMIDAFLADKREWAVRR